MFMASGNVEAGHSNHADRGFPWRTPDPRLAGSDLGSHLLFTLEHEGVNLQVLTVAMGSLSASQLADALAQTPNGQYVRMLCSTWEQFTGREVVPRPAITASYVDLFGARRYITASPDRVDKDSRWSVNFNGLGTWRHCVRVERTEAIEQGLAADA